MPQDCHPWRLSRNSRLFPAAAAIAQVDHPAVSGGTFRLSYGTGGTYSGLDRFGRVIEQLWVGSGGTTTLDRFRYGYDRMGNRLWRETYGNNAYSEYYGPGGTGHDSLNRLIQAKRGTLSGSYGAYGAPATVTHQEDYDLEALGNWRGYKVYNDGDLDLDQTRGHNSVNEIDTNDDHADAAGNAIAASTGDNWIDPTYDAAGNMAGAAAPSAPTTRLHFTYDAWNRLVAYTDSSDNVIAEYRYDGLNRRIAKLLAGDDWDRTDYYYNEGWQVLEERLAEDVDEADKDDPATTMRCQYVWDIRYIDAPVVRFRDTNGDGTADDTLYYCTDANMNATALVDASDATVAERYVYDPYGLATIRSPDFSSAVSWASSKQNEIRYAGYRYDPETSLYHVRNRYYHPALGRWISRDPLGYLPGTNRYAYLHNAPNSRTDPQGTWGDDIHLTATEVWARTVGVREDYAFRIAHADSEVDPHPWTLHDLFDEEELSWHFDVPPQPDPVWREPDSRYMVSEDELDSAVSLCVLIWDSPEFEWEFIAHTAAFALGQSLHPLQDFYAHGSWNPVAPHPFWRNFLSGGHPTDNPRWDWGGSPDRLLRRQDYYDSVNGDDLWIQGPTRYNRTQEHTRRQILDFKAKLIKYRPKTWFCLCVFFEDVMP
jgi:RHS repeat-associated protein